MIGKVQWARYPALASSCLAGDVALSAPALHLHLHLYSRALMPRIWCYYGVGTLCTALPTAAAAVTEARSPRHRQHSMTRWMMSSLDHASISMAVLGRDSFPVIKPCLRSHRQHAFPCSSTSASQQRERSSASPDRHPGLRLASRPSCKAFTPITSHLRTCIHATASPTSTAGPRHIPPASESSAMRQSDNEPTQNLPTNQYPCAGRYAPPPTQQQPRSPSPARGTC